MSHERRKQRLAHCVPLGFSQAFLKIRLSVTVGEDGNGKLGTREVNRAEAEKEGQLI